MTVSAPKTIQPQHLVRVNQKPDGGTCANIWDGFRVDLKFDTGLHGQERLGVMFNGTGGLREQTGGDELNLAPNDAPELSSFPENFDKPLHRSCHPSVSLR